VDRGQAALAEPMTDDAQREAFDILAGCSTGATHDALLAVGCTETALAALCRRGLVSRRTAALANPRGLIVTRYWITDAGKKESPC
jgi:predicted acylesterase/phospholipase RssA